MELEHADIASRSNRHFRTIVLHGPPHRLPYFARYAYLPSADRYILNAVHRSTTQTIISDYFAHLGPEKEYWDKRDLPEVNEVFSSLQVGMSQTRFDRPSSFAIELRYNGLRSSFAPTLALQGWAPVFRSLLSVTSIGAAYRGGASMLLLGADLSPSLSFRIEQDLPSHDHHFNVVSIPLPFQCQVTHSGDTHTTMFYLTRVPGF